MTTRVLLVEPFMKGLVGHSAGIARRIANELLDAGATVQVIGPIDAPVATWDPACELLTSWPASPVLRERFWAKYPVVSQLRNLMMHAVYARRVRSCLARAYADFHPDVVAVLTCTPSEFYGLASAPKGPGLIAITHAVNRPQRIARIALERFARRCGDGSRFAVGVFTDEMRDSYAADGIPMDSIVRISYPPPARTAAPGPAAYEPGDRLRLVYAGDARLEKGFVLLTDAIERLAQEYDLTVQCCPPVIGSYEPVIAQAVERLQAIDSPSIDLLTGILPELEFAKLLASGHAVLIPYDPAVYRGGRLSGIMHESLAAGIPLIISDGWAPAEEIRRNGAGVVFEYGNADSLLEAVGLLRADYPRYREAAGRVAEEIANGSASTGTAGPVIAWATAAPSRSVE